MRSAMLAAVTFRKARFCRLLVGCALLTPLVAVAGCSAGDPSATPTASASAVAAVPGWPSALAAIGHSGLTGYDSANPGQDARTNSWATGENPDVDSVYSRILESNPAIENRVTNVAVDGSGVVDLLRQAKQIIAVTPEPELVLIQSIDNDIQCDGTDAENLPNYRAGLVEVMDTLASGLPKAKILFVSQWATVATYDAAAVQIDPEHLAGGGICDVVDPATLQIVQAKEAALQTLVNEYFAAIVDVCAAYENCSTDGGAMQSMALAPEDLSPDLNHLSVSGHAKMAAIAWDVLYPGK